MLFQLTLPELRQVVNPSSFVRLYEDCLRADEGIRYRRAESKLNTISRTMSTGNPNGVGYVISTTQQPTEQSDGQQFYRYIEKLIQAKLNNQQN